MIAANTDYACSLQQGAATPMYTVLAAVTGIKMTSFRSFMDVHGKPVRVRVCTEIYYFDLKCLLIV